MTTYSPRPGTLAARYVAGLITCALFFSTAFAAPPTQSLSVTVQGDGEVKSNPNGISCPGDCSGSYKKSSQVTRSAIPDPDSRFLGWEGACTGTQPTCTWKIRSSTRVTALFETTMVDDPAVDTVVDVIVEPEPDTTGSVVDVPVEQEPDTTDPVADVVVEPDGTTVETIQIGWPVFSQ